MKKSFTWRFVFPIIGLSIAFNACKKSASLPGSAADTHVITQSVPSVVIPSITQRSKIIYLTSTDQIKMWLINYDGSKNQQIIPDIPGNSILSNYGTPKLSFDRTKIYFAVCVGSGASHCIYSSNIDGSGAVPIITDTIYPVIAGIYKEGAQDKILYKRCDFLKANPTMEFWTANEDGTGQQKINVTMPSGADFYPDGTVAISPDGQTIFFAASLADGNVAIFSSDIKGGNAMPVTTGIHSYESIGFTYNIGTKQQIVYSNLLGGPGVVLTSNLFGTDVQQIPLSLPDGVNLDWNPPAISPDGKTLIFNTITINGKENGLYSSNIDGTGLTRILTFGPDVNGYNIGQVF